MAPRFTIRMSYAFAEDMYGIRATERRRIHGHIGKTLEFGALTLVEGQREPVKEPVPDGIRQRVEAVLQGGQVWSLHVGRYRVLYAVEGQTVHVVAVGDKDRKTLAGTFPDLE